MKAFLNKFPLDKFSIFITVVISVTHNLLVDRNLDCTCIDVSMDCSIYMALPSLIFCVLILLTDEEFLKTCSYAIIRLFGYCRNSSCCKGEEKAAPQEEKREEKARSNMEENETFMGGPESDRETSPKTQGPTKKTPDAASCGQKCKQCRKNLWGIIRIFLFHFFKAGLVGLLWVATVLMDGDWYVCCQNDEHPQLACKDKTYMAADDRVTLAKLKNKSRNIGFFVLLAIVFLVTLMSLLDRGYCNVKCRRCDGRTEYDELILKEKEDILMDVLCEVAKDKLNEAREQKTEKKTWTELFNVVQEMAEISRKPNLPEVEEEENRASGEDEREDSTVRGGGPQQDVTQTSL